MIEVKITKRVIISMPEEDAIWLMLVMQNPIDSESTGSETDANCEIRCNFFKSIKEKIDG